MYKAYFPSLNTCNIKSVNSEVHDVNLVATNSCHYPISAYFSTSRLSHNNKYFIVVISQI